MKKLLFILSFVALAFISPSADAQAFSQTTFNSTGAYSNTGLDTMTFTTNKDYLLVGIQPVITRLTGTMAGTAVLYGSINGTNYVATGDTLTFTNAATNTTVWTKTNPVYTYWRIIVGGATTVTATAAARFVGRSPNR